MSAAPVIHWIERSPYLHEARLTADDGADLYAGYVAVSPGYDDWRGYVGRGFIPVGLGSRPEMQAAVEQHARDVLAQGEGRHRADDLGIAVV